MDMVDWTQQGSRPARAHLRVPIDVFVRVAGADRDYAFRTRDVSAGGLFLYTRVGHLYPLSVGVAVTVELVDGGRVFTLRGEVVREVQPGTEEAQRYPAGFALRLQPIPEAERDAFERLIARHRQP
jgi:hypothetical protein